MRTRISIINIYVRLNFAILFLDLRLYFMNCDPVFRICNSFFHDKAYIPLRRKTTGIGALRWVRTPTRRFCVIYTNMFVSKNAKVCITPNANAKICFTPNAKPQRESVEYRLRWVLNTKFSRWPCTFHFFGVHFIRVGSRFSVEHGL